MTDDDMIRQLPEMHEDFVHVADLRAYEAFRDGLILFDVTPDARLLTEFKSKNNSEFGPSMALRADGSFRAIMYQPGQVIWTLYHKYAILERLTPMLQDMEKDPRFSGFSSLFSE